MFWLLIDCPSCRRRGVGARTRRQNTMYLDDRLNWVRECDECFERTEDHWNDLWEDYYNSRGV